MKIAIIDNYDSFTYNLSHLVKELGAEVTVFRNDQFELPQLESFSKIILSPGPGIPSEAGLLLDVIRTYAGKKPILGVCLVIRLLARYSAENWRTFPRCFTVSLQKGHSLVMTRSFLDSQAVLPWDVITHG